MAKTWREHVKETWQKHKGEKDFKFKNALEIASKTWKKGGETKGGEEKEKKGGDDLAVAEPKTVSDSPEVTEKVSEPTSASPAPVAESKSNGKEIEEEHLAMGGKQKRKNRTSKRGGRSKKGTHKRGKKTYKTRK